MNDGYQYRCVVEPKFSNRTAVDFLAIRYDHSTLDQWKERFAAGEIEINDAVANGQERLFAGDRVVWNRPAWLEPDAPTSYQIVYSDRCLLAVDKPSGLPTLPGAGYYQNTLLSLVRRDFPEAKPLHRLGRWTSGIVLFALDAGTAAAMTRQWSHVVKQYQALASGVANLDFYDINDPIGPCQHAKLGTIHAASPQGKPSRSIARALNRDSQNTIFEVDLCTGRPHQIRIHLACIGHPLVGDPVYDVGGIPKTIASGLPGDSGYHLHAKRVALTHPFSQKRIEILATLPHALRVS